MRFYLQMDNDLENSEFINNINNENKNENSKL